MKGAILRCVKCHIPKTVLQGALVPNSCPKCGGQFVYVDELTTDRAPNRVELLEPPYTSDGG